MIKIRTILLLGTVSLFFISSPASAQNLPAQWTWAITSDFGPRNTKSGWDFHEGVDYNADDDNADLGTPIPAVESGQITSISDPVSENFLTIRVQGDTTGDVWLYGHIFRNSTQKVGEWELRRNALHIDVLDPTIQLRASVIIKFSGGSVVKILSTIPNSKIADGAGGYLSNAQGPVLTRRHVDAQEEIAPMGDSNATVVPVHLHLGLNYPNDNPMAHLQHPPDPLLTATVVDPPEKMTYVPSNLAGPVRFEANLKSLNALDVDSVTFRVDRDTAPILAMGASGQPTFSFGGRPGETKNVDGSISPTASRAGVAPQGNVPGSDNFVFYQDISALQDGLYSYVVACQDVNNHDGCNNSGASRKFRIQRTSIVLLDAEDQELPSTPTPPNNTNGNWVSTSALKFSLVDSDGIVQFDIFHGPGPVFELIFTTTTVAGTAVPYPTYAAITPDGPPIDDSPNYYIARLTDVGNHVEERYFLLDRRAPRGDAISATVDVRAGTMLLTGQVTDEASGVASALVLTGNQLPPPYTGERYPEDPPSLGVTNTVGPGVHYINGRDKSGKAGGPAQITYSADLVQISNGSGLQPGNAGNLLKEVYVSVDDFQILQGGLDLEYRAGRLIFDPDPAVGFAGGGLGARLPDVGRAIVSVRSETRTSATDFVLTGSPATTLTEVLRTDGKMGPYTEQADLVLASELEWITTDHTSSARAYSAILLVPQPDGSTLQQPTTIDAGQIIPILGDVNPAPGFTDLVRPTVLAANVFGLDGNSFGYRPVSSGINTNIFIAPINIFIPNLIGTGFVGAGPVSFLAPNEFKRSSKVYDVQVTAQYTGKLRISMRHDKTITYDNDLLLGASAKTRMWRFHNNTWTDITTAYIPEGVEGETEENSLFMLAIKDGVAPVTSASFVGRSIELPNHLMLVSTKTGVTLSAVDPVVDDHVDTGIRASYYSTDGIFASTSQAGVAAYDDTPFTLPEGLVALSYASEDGVHNVEAATMTIVAVDGTAPDSTLSITGPMVVESSRVIVGPQTFFSLSAVDPVSGGVSAGTAAVAMLIDNTLEGCGLSLDGPPVIVPGAPPGSCGNPLYSAPFAVAEGSHTLGYLGIDNVLNAEALTSTSVIGDYAPPSLSFTTAPYYASAHPTLTAVLADSLAGLATSALSLSVDGATVSFTPVYSGVGGGPPTSWATGSPLPNPIHLQGFALLNGRLYSIAGHDGSNNARADVNVAPLAADGAPGAWSATAPLPEGRNDLVAVPALGRLYALGGNPPGGGFGTNTVFYAAPQGDGSITQWDSASLPESIAGLSAVGFTAAGTHLFAIGGYDGSGPKRGVWASELDGDTGAPGTWARLDDLPADLAEAHAVEWGGRVYVLGGFAPDASVTSNKVYSAQILGGTLGPWNTERDMPLHVRALGAAAVQGRLYALGGLDSSGGVHDDVYSAAINGDGTLEAWRQEPDLPRPLAAFGVASSDFGIYVAGGYDGSAIVADTRFALGEPGTVLLARLSGTSAATLSDGVHTVGAAGADRVENGSGGSTQFTVDATPPSILTLSADGVLLSSTSSRFINGSTPLLRATLYDATSGLDPPGVKLFLDGAVVAQNPPAPATEISFTPSASLTTGRHVLKAVGADKAGNPATFSAVFVIDDVPPDVALSSPAQGAIFGAGPVPVAAAFSDALSGLATGQISLSVDGATRPTSVSAAGVGSLKEWLNAPDLPGPIHLQGFALLDGRLYSVGGHDGGGARADANVAALGPDGLPGAWTPTTPLPSERSDLVAVPALGRIYALGGSGGSIANDTVYYAAPGPDGLIDQWQTAALPGPLGGLSAASFVTSGTDIFALGGFDPAGSSQNGVHVSRLDPVTGLPGPWHTLTPMPARLGHAPAVQLGGRLYILGGFTDNGSNTSNRVFSARLADHDLVDWREEPSLPLSARLVGGAALLGKVYALGGLDGAGGVHAEIYSAVVGTDAALGAWQQEAQSLPGPLSAFGAASSDSAIYVAGGYDGAGIRKEVRAVFLDAPTTANATVLGLTQGAHEARAAAADLAGNATFASSTFHVDLTGPETTLVVSGSSKVIGSSVFAPTGAAASFTSVDQPAGVALTRYAIGAGPVQDFTGDVLLGEGTWTISFNSIDSVGNAESTKTATLKLDATAPGAATNALAVPLSTGDIRVSWNSPGDDDASGDILDGSVRIDVKPIGESLDFADSRIVLASGTLQAGRALSAVVGGLAENTAYHVAVFTRDTLGLWATAFTPAQAQTFFLESSSDNVVALHSPDSDATVLVVTTETAPTAYAVAISSALEPVSEFYELNAVIPAETAARLVFVLPAGYDLDSLAIYTLTAEGWSSDSIVNQQVVDLGNGFIEVSGEISHTSLYAVLVRDLTPPRTTLTVSGPRYDLEGREFHRAPAAATLSAEDFAPPGGTPSGLAATYVSLDAAVEQVYSAAFALAEGRRIIGFRSSDLKGNDEVTRSSEVYVDSSAPTLDMALDQPTITIPGGFATTSATATLSLGALEPEVGGARSGLAGASYVLDGATVTLPVTPGDATSGAAVPLGAGFHIVVWRASDRVGHAVERSLRVSVGDASLPALSFSFPRQDEPGLPRLAQGTVTVRGSASDELLASWELRAGSVLLGSGTANASGMLGVWDGAAQSGLVTLKLSALDEGGNAALAELPVFGGTPARVLALGGKSVLSAPRGVAWGPDRIYVADTAKDRIRVFDGAGALVATYGANSGPLKFAQPWGVAVDSAGNIYVADAGKKRVVKLAPDGAFLTEYGGPTLLNKPVAVALVPGKILVGDAKAGEIVAFTPDGSILQRVVLVDGPLAPPESEDTSEDIRPMALASDAAGNVWVADARGGQLLKYTPTLAWAQTISGLSRPEGVAVTPSGSVVAVSEAKKHRLSTYDAELGARLALWGEQGSIKEGKPIPAELFLKTPSQLAFTTGGNLLVADRGNDMVQGFGLPGTPLVAAMAGGSGGTHLAAFGDEGFGVSALDPDSSFALRDVYAFPNPAVRGEKPTVHVAVGKADKVTVKFYDLAGTPVHEATLGSPAVVNDESGPQWAYEYAWDGHIPSGVYLYAVTAEKAGSAPITRVGKLAVVR